MPLRNELTKKILDKIKDVEEWYRSKSKDSPPPFYSSIDIRDSGFKIVPVDNNLFPAGFNNLCPKDIVQASVIFKRQLEKRMERIGRPNPKKVLILPEAHTANKFYIENVIQLISILENAGFEAKLGWYGATSFEPVRLEAANGQEIYACPIEIRDGLLSACDFQPDAIILNNDFSSGYPRLLDTVNQPIFPSHTLGWHTRRKSEHFKHYNDLAAEFAKVIGADPWNLQVETHEVSDINFNEDAGLDRTAQVVEDVIGRLRKEYQARSIQQDPFVFVKSNAGTYGMGIMVVRSGEELLHLNRREKNKMSVGKNRSAVTSVIVQEGVPTSTFFQEFPAEPVIYLSGCDLLGGFLRSNTEKGAEDNLNSKGMVFQKLCMSDLSEYLSPREVDPDLKDVPVIEMTYGMIARISALATGKELTCRP